MSKPLSHLCTNHMHTNIFTHDRWPSGGIKKESQQNAD